MDIPVTSSATSTDRTVGAQAYEFSVVRGGPLYQLLRLAHLSGDALELLRRRLVVILLVAWVPLLALSALRGQAWGRTVAVPFLTDIEVHIRLLLALPLLIATELVVRKRTRGMLGQVARCGLKLVPTHPDHVGGLGFLEGIPIALAPFLLAHGLAVGGLICNQIFFHGAKLIDFKFELVAVLVFLLIVVLASLLRFVPRRARLKRAGLQEYGVFAQRYVREFDDKWIRGSALPTSR